MFKDETMYKHEKSPAEPISRGFLWLGYRLKRRTVFVLFLERLDALRTLDQLGVLVPLRSLGLPAILILLRTLDQLGLLGSLRSLHLTVVLVLL